MSEETIQKEVIKRGTRRKVRTGIVHSAKRDKTITVKTQVKRLHPLYGKIVSSTQSFSVHDEKNEAREGDFVEIMETRPLSKTKRWRLVKIIQQKEI